MVSLFEKIDKIRIADFLFDFSEPSHKMKAKLKGSFPRKKESVEATFTFLA
jgi:hypothetical protein